MSKTPKTETPAEQARAAYETRQAVVTEHERREADLSARVSEHERLRDAGAFEFDSLALIEDEAHLRAERMFLEAQRPHLEVARQTADSYARREKVTDLEERRRALREKRAAVVATVREALAERRAEVEAYNSELVGLIGEARRAGLVEGEADPSLPVLMGGGEHKHPRRLTVEGREHRALSTDTDQIIREARR